MRNAFADEITKLGVVDPRVVLLSGDIGNKLFDKYKDGAPVGSLTAVWQRQT
jgi:transketolase